MNLLLEKLPEEVLIDGVGFPIQTDFRTSIKFALFLDSDASDFEKIYKMLELYYGDSVPSNIEEAINKALWFYAGGEENINPGRKKKEKSHYFDYDAGYIFAAFKDQYEINLNKADYLHWWEFLAMFMGLKEDNEISKIIGYRLADTSKMSSEYKKHYAKLKKAFSPPVKKKQQKQLDTLEERLLKGESIDDLL